MAYKEVLRVEIWEVIRRWRKGHSQRRIASGRGLSRDTVVRYITAAEALGVSRLGPEPSEEHLSRLAVVGQPGPLVNTVVVQRYGQVERKGNLSVLSFGGQLGQTLGAMVVGSVGGLSEGTSVLPYRVARNAQLSSDLA